MTLDLWLALLCGFLFAVGALLVKRGNQLGVGASGATLVSNLSTAAAFVFLWPLGGQIPSWGLWWQPFVVALLFVAGQAFVFMAYHRGDVSLATPILGVKIILVALGASWLIGEPLSWRIWTGAALSTLAVALLNRTDTSSSGKAGVTVLLAGGCAASFALFDVLVQKWGPAWGAGRFLPVMMAMVSVISIIAHLVWGGGSLGLTGAPAPWILGGSAIIALQSAIFVTAIVIYKNAAPANVCFSSRGLWSVVLVWAAGHWFHSHEQRHGAAVMRWRLAGAALMMAAIALVMLGK